MNRWQYFLGGVKNMKTRGTIAPTSKFTSKKMLSNIRFEQADLIVELGAGDGSITKHILSEMRKDTKLISFEIDPVLCGILKENFSDDRLTIINDSAEHLVEHLTKLGYSQADYVVSGIPFVMLPEDLGDRILKASKSILSMEGCFIQFHYSLIPKKRYKRIFNQLDIELEMRNLPPAFVYVCK